ncbi:MAG: hypothetical protein JRF08_01650 [Deltaproteobacteria bacterium]|nr:hypothetical protein [Deltaproteobacteria bacterium]MBW2332188.1 hypothetical protein [Deltaproteobacteria bacterium]RLB21663.1 MAG: hypothetical protein DRG73_08145 [Deltaproteobacteria bacterium]HDH86941.1 hypothetical protein [Desulfobacteraceae bacterium]
MEKNPFLGYCSIRVFLRQKVLYKEQLKAILRTNAYGHMKSLFPTLRLAGCHLLCLYPWHRGLFLQHDWSKAGALSAN